MFREKNATNKAAKPAEKAERTSYKEKAERTSYKEKSERKL
jgi:hypothetical protein